MIFVLQEKSERIEQLENDLNLSEKVSFALDLIEFFLFNIIYQTAKLAFSYSKLKASESFIWLNKK